MKKFLLLGLTFFIFSCNNDVPKMAVSVLESDKKPHGFKERIYQTKNFQVFTLQKITDPNAPYRIYLEGDGKSFIGKNRPSPNPTPTSNFLIDLVKEDGSENIIYIARPCQFVTDQKCQNKYWTSARFSPEIMNSVNEVLNNFSKYDVEIVAYSGGATIAKYLIPFNKNVISFRTIAGNLDNKKFAQIHHVAPMDKPTTKENFEYLSRIPQIHFVGVEDEIIPKEIVKSYLSKMSYRGCATTVMVKKATHTSGWKEGWKRLLKIKSQC